jgi:transcriptional regulator with XRE-family HTH domain
VNNDEIVQVQKECAKLLMEHRLRKGLSMTALAAKAGVSQQMVSFIERGKRKPTLDVLLRICFAMQISLAEVLEKALRKSKL